MHDALDMEELLSVKINLNIRINGLQVNISISNQVVPANHMTVSHLIYVILLSRETRNPRNVYILNLAVSGIIMSVFCVPPTLLQILYGGVWHMGVIACKLVPVIQGTNILVSAFTITVIAVDRWLSVMNTNPRDSQSYISVTLVVIGVWMISFTVTSPLLFFQTLEGMDFPIKMEICTENFPKEIYKSSFTLIILLFQYLMPLIVFAHCSWANSGFQSDERRKEREMKRNRKMTLVLSFISIIFAISWLPLHLYLIITDLYSIEVDQETYYLFLGLCHSLGLSTSFTNPVLYGWFNTNLRSELEKLIPLCCRRYLHIHPKSGRANRSHNSNNNTNINVRDQRAPIVHPIAATTRQEFRTDLMKSCPSEPTQKLEPRRD
ncbi:NPFR [Lepeophtheirus salmonis]|uniref:NPFR n=1 Tax=Lepeophtheirus salmonis TaxID=72036 RepID=A0A7R8CWL5_LEPSM|nr:NPFR [Lepeophtheirus salmonis]CAF2952948.1 NPFR [Lepeophtheirus salmonis]